jgi:membrane-bound lytic murein transglycosylase D
VQQEVASALSSQLALVETPEIEEGITTTSGLRNEVLDIRPEESGAPESLGLDNQSVLPNEDLDFDQDEIAQNGADAQISVAESEAIALESDIEILPTETQLAEFLAADPSDYSVASNGSIEAQASETLGHFADWLDIRAWDIRRLNNMAYRDPVIIGKRLSLNFDKVSRADFELRRRDFHFNMQREFFATYRIQDVEEYEITRGDNISRIARSRYSAPLWLIRQYNPEIDFNRIRVGQKVVFPVLATTQL